MFGYSHEYDRAIAIEDKEETDIEFAEQRALSLAKKRGRREEDKLLRKWWRLRDYKRGKDRTGMIS